MAWEKKYPKTKPEELVPEDPEVKDDGSNKEDDDDEDNQFEFATDGSVIVNKSQL